MISRNLLKIIILSTISFVSCKKVVEFNLPEQDPKIIVYSLFNPDSIFKVYIGKTTNLNDTSANYIDNAQCKLYENNIYLFDLVNTGQGIYTAENNFTPQAGNKYKIEVSCKDLPTVYAEDSIPLNKPNFSITQILDSIRVTYDGEYYTDIFIDINDSASTKDYYEFEIIVREDTVEMSDPEDSEYFNNLLSTYYAYINSDDPILLNEAVSGFYPEHYPFSDTLFQGQIHNFDLYFLVGLFLGYETQKAKSTYFITVKKITYNYYLYRKKLLAHQNNQIGDFWEGGTSPVQMYSNIHNGYGIFAGYNSKTDSIKNY